MRMTRRGKIRLIVFTIAALVILLVRNVVLMSENRHANLILESSYLRAMEDLSAAADNINTTLSKELCAGSAAMQSKLSAQLLSEASTAKNALAQLPVEQLELSNTYKFLSQVGNYATYLSDKSSGGEKLTDEEYETLKKLSGYAQKLCGDMWAIEQMINSGELSPENVVDSLDNSAADEGDISVTDGFADFEDGFESYPTLIYDGPFSDHLLQRKPLMTENADAVSEGYAQAKACKALAVKPDELTASEGEAGNMPSYVYNTDTGSVAVTKNGGYISYMLKSRTPEKTVIDAKKAISHADKYLEQLGVENMQVTYYETLGNVCTVNYAYRDGNVLCYTDLIKIKVAMDNGEILGFDARGFLVNHKDRTFESPKMTSEEAAENVSKHLEVKNVRECNIPLDNTKECYCYEFTCLNDEGRHVLVYIDCMTGEEAQILMLFESDGGVLAQ